MFKEFRLVNYFFILLQLNFYAFSSFIFFVIVQSSVILFIVAVVNVTFPDDKQNYIHRIGRVGRADRYVFKNLF